MATAQPKAKPLRSKICLLNTAQYNNWKKNDLPRLESKYPKFSYIRMVDTSTDKNYLWYKIR